MHSVNFIAVLVSAFAGFAIGGLWYGPLFGKAWMRHSGMTFERGKQQNKLVVFGGAYVLNGVIATGLALLTPEGTGWQIGLHTGVMAGVFFIAPALGIIHLFESKPFGLWAINAGYQIVLAGVIGAILSAWP
ncbi:MAG: DUF1761 domain-containing protein [Steroidobacteraceae bacterium]